MAPRGASADDWHSMRSVRYGYIPHPFPLAGAERARLVPDRVGHAQPAEVVGKRRAVKGSDILGRQPEPLPARGSEVGHAS